MRFKDYGSITQQGRMKFDIEIHEYCLMILSDDLNPATIPLSQILRVKKKWESVLSAPLIWLLLNLLG